MNYLHDLVELENLRNEFNLILRDHQLDVEQRRVDKLINQTPLNGGLGPTLEESCKRGYELITKRHSKKK